MKLIYKIALNEIRYLFFSPVAWFLGVAFLLQCGYFYTSQLAQMAGYQDVAIGDNPKFEGFGISLTNVILLKGGLFSSVVGNLYLFVPLLTMSLINREINSGTIKLLYSSPIKPYHIVLGKYLAIVLYNLMLLGIVAIFLISSMFSIVHMDAGLIFSSMLALFLLICCYTALGLFMSSLSTYPIVSAISTFLIIFLLTAIGTIGQQYDFVRDLTYFLSANGRTDKMIAGLITSGDVIYYLLIIGMFLCFTLFRVKGAMESRPWLTKALQYVSVFVGVLAIGYITSRPAFMGYWDVTRNEVNTIHPNSQKVIKDFEKGEPLEVTLYVNLLGGGLDQGGLPENRKNYEISFWERYVRFKPEIKLKYVNYYDVADNDSMFFKMYPKKTVKEVAETVAKLKKVNLSNYESPKQIRKEIDLRPEGLRVVMQLKYKGRSTFLRTYDDPDFWPNEMNVSAAFKRLQQPIRPKFIFTSGNLERSVYKTGEREYHYQLNDISNRFSMTNLGFDTDSVNLDQQEIPKGIAALVIADPKTNLSAVKQEKIKRYIAEGGNTLILGEPGKQAMLNPVLTGLGLQLNPGTLIELTANETPEMVKPQLTKEGLSLSDQFILQRADLVRGKKMPELEILTPSVSEVAVVNSATGFKAQPILKTNPSRNAFNKIGKVVVDSVPPVYNPSGGDTKQKSYSTLLSLSREVKQKEQRVAVSGDADFMSKLRRGGGLFSIALFSWLDHNRLPIYIVPKTPVDVLLTISLRTAEIIKIVFVWILPAAIACMGAILLLRRKRK